jgi:acyl carrier protein
MNLDKKIDEICNKLRNLLAELGLELSENFEGFNFVTESHLDSFELINFITDVEIEFNVQFTAEDLANDRHHSINGLAELILKTTR